MIYTLIKQNDKRKADKENAWQNFLQARPGSINSDGE
jgi:hypothetical protein